jgi:LDH2 family malate/lactate/ureidoglycolate dehydrogenase
MSIIDMDKLIEFYTNKLMEKGVDRKRSFELARAQVEVHAFGTDTHGLPPLHNMLNQLEKEPKACELPRITREFGGVVCADSSLTPGVEPILWGAEKASDLAAVHGIGFVSLTNGGWVGTMGYHLARWAQKGYIMMSWNQMSSIPFVTPFGGRDPRFNTSPMAFSFPMGGEWKDAPLVADFSTAAISRGKTGRMIREGISAPEDYYIDSEGNPTANPETVEKGGSILPFGGAVSGFRGTALAMLIEAMTCAAGAIPANGEKKGSQNVHVFALSIEALGDISGYEELMSAMTGWVLDSRPVPDGSGVRYPGQRGWAALERARKEGVSVEGSHWGSS